MSFLLLSTVPETQPCGRHSALCVGTLHWAGSVHLTSCIALGVSTLTFIAGEVTRITLNSDSSDKEERGYPGLVSPH